ncbi:reverse transcriptase [Nonomuraea sp. K274]|uniref:Reverse transcriptase n=1 Tax=Nonomuraea cypriaca TaxID=1187855 RepID=A0A931F6X1_9ACTN|nr:reverse transcriptase domain-containing protein [Nonomuraea cypriaca]MBF8193733.1 reverse transcriptase [Nonomuraea cypriaca]
MDAVSTEVFEKDLKNNLYRIWNRMASGTYFPPPVRAVEIPKKGGVRILGVPTIGDRIAQTVVARVLERKAEPVFHPDSYGYRPGRSAIDAVGRCRERCWKAGWVIDLDIRTFFDSVPWDLVLKAVAAHTDPSQSWVLLYVRRWLAAPLQLPDGTRRERNRGTPQGSSSRRTAVRKDGGMFLSFMPAISGEALSRISSEVRSWRLHHRTNLTEADLARVINPIIRGWMAYYGAFYKSALYPLLERINAYLMRWMRKKFKRLRGRKRAQSAWNQAVERRPRFFAHWAWSTHVPRVW